MFSPGNWNVLPWDLELFLKLSFSFRKQIEPSVCTMARLSVVLVLFLFLLNPAVTSGDDGSEAEDSENDWLEEIEIEKHTLELIPGSRIENTWLALDNNCAIMCKNILDSNLRERVQNQLPKAASLKSAGTRAKLKGIPKAPKTLKNVDWSQLPVPIEHHLLASDPALCLYVFGTEKLAREFFESTFKSCDGTFKIAPILIILAAEEDTRALQ